MELAQPVINVIGRLTAALGASMLVPAALDLADGHEGWKGVVTAAYLTIIAGAAMAMVAGGRISAGLSRRQAFLLTVLVWLVLPIFGALPFVFGPPYAGYTDAFFEAMSGLTTTGATVFEGLDEAPRGMLLWRAMLQWFGGVGIVVFAMVFLPMLKIGGMQFFHSEGFDLGGGILLRATEVAAQLGWIYLGLTIACTLAYAGAGMTPFEAICHAMTTVSTGRHGNQGQRVRPVLHRGSLRRRNLHVAGRMAVPAVHSAQPGKLAGTLAGSADPRLRHDCAWGQRSHGALADHPGPT